MTTKYIICDYVTGRYWGQYFYSKSEAEKAIKDTGRNRDTFLIEETGEEL